MAASTAAVRTVLSVGRVKGIWDGGWGCGEPVYGCGTEPKVHCFRRSHLLVECGARGELLIKAVVFALLAKLC